MKLADLFKSPVLYSIFNLFLPDAEDQARAIITSRPETLYARLREFRCDLARLEEWLADRRIRAIQDEELGRDIRRHFRSPSRGSDSS